MDDVGHNASERARRLLQIITSFGVRQWTVLPFGVTNGPSYFQEFMLDLYGQTSGRPSLLGDMMKDLDACLEIWIDDVQLGSSSIVNASGKTSPDDPKGFDQHMQAIERVLERASTVNLRFKLSKCFFAQFALETLGMIAGVGCVKADPKKK